MITKTERSSAPQLRIPVVLAVLAVLWVLVSGCSKDTKDNNDNNDAGDTDSDSDSDTDTDTNSDSDSDTDTDTDTDTDADTDTDTDSDTDSDTDTGVAEDHDEDGDGVIDSADNCPTYSNLSQADTDEDGLGDACEAGWDAELLGSVAFFSPLALTADWTAESGTWTDGVDAMTGTATTSGGNTWYGGYELGAGAYSVETVIGNPYASAPGVAYSGVLFARQTAGVTTWWSCQFDRYSRLLAAWYDNGSALSCLDSVLVTGTGGSDGWRRVRATFDGLTLTCTFDDSSASSAQLVLEDLDVPADMTGGAGLRAYNDTAEFLSFTIYD